MDPQETRIINLAVNIFQNVGIKRYIGSIEALMHEDIYFQIYKIIFPDSMINIFKISDSSLTTGQKIQRVIDQISAIIGVDLYHIEGRRIASGNMSHLANWLQLLEALSARCVPAAGYPTCGSAPCRQKERCVDYDNDGNFTVIGNYKEFNNHWDSEQGDEDEESSPQESETNVGPDEEQISNEPTHESPVNGSPTNRQPVSACESSDSNLKPKELTKKKQEIKVQNPKRPKKVTFNLNGSGNTSIKKKPMSKSKARSSNFSSTTDSRKKLSSKISHRKPTKNQQDKLLCKKINYINKMHNIVEEIEKSKINEHNREFRNWIVEKNQNAMAGHLRIEEENRMRTELFNYKINERDKLVEALLGEKETYKEMKAMFKFQKKNEKKIQNYYVEQMWRQAEQLMDEDFADDLQQMVMVTLEQ